MADIAYANTTAGQLSEWIPYQQIWLALLASPAINQVPRIGETGFTDGTLCHAALQNPLDVMPKTEFNMSKVEFKIPKTAYAKITILPGFFGKV